MGNLKQEADLQAAIAEHNEAIGREMTEVRDRLSDLERKLADAPTEIDLSDEIAAIRASTASVQNMVQSAPVNTDQAPPDTETAPAPIEEAAPPAPADETAPPAEGETTNP